MSQENKERFETVLFFLVMFGAYYTVCLFKNIISGYY